MVNAARLEALQRKHQELEQAIGRLERQPQHDDTGIKKLKIEKLVLKDRIAELTAPMPIEMAAE